MLTYTLNVDSKELCTDIPQDTIPVSAMEGNYFFLHHDLVISPPSLIKITSFKQYINTLPQWKRNLISNYEESTTHSSLAEAIQMKQKFIIASDGSKSKSTSGGAWLIANMNGETFIEGTNPDFGHISQIHSHRAEIYGVLSVFIFIKAYSNYFMLPFLSAIEYHGDNLEIVHKINILANDPNYFDELHKTTDHDAVLQLKLCFPKEIIAFHVKSHQDLRKKQEHLTLPERLNIKADKLIENKARAPLNKHILQTSLAIYVNGKYIPNNYVNSIRAACGEKDAKDFLMRKYHWNNSTIENI